MKTKMILLAALAGAAVMSVSSARAGVHFGISFGVPAPVVVAAPAPVYYQAPAPVVVTAPAPVYYAGPVAPAPIVEVQTVCPGAGYVWAPGYWAHRDAGFVWVRGGWNYQWHDRDVRHWDRDGHYYGHDRR